MSREGFLLRSDVGEEYEFCGVKNGKETISEHHCVLDGIVVFR